MSIGINRGKPPLIAFGTPEDVSASPWTNLGTSPGVTGSQADPFGGTGAYLITDNDGATAEGRRSGTFTIDDTISTIMVFMKAGTASASEFILRDITGAANKCIGRIIWSGPTLSIVGGTGTAFDLVSLGNSWYLAIISNITTVSGNTHQFWIYGAKSSAATTGTTLYYIRSSLLIGDPLDRANAFGAPREGSEFLQTDGGVEDAWITGIDQLLMGGIRWIPAELQEVPRPGSPWNGDGDFATVNLGWDHFLNDWAREKQTFLWVPNRAIADENVSSYLVEPMQGNPGLEADFTRQLNFIIRSSDGSKYKGY